MSLEHSLRAARAEAPAWSPDRAARVFAGVSRAHETRRSRRRLAGRALFVASFALLVVLTVLKSSASPPPSAHDDSAVAAPEPVAWQFSGDGGYGRD